MEVSFIIVNYNVTDLLRRCIASVYRFAVGVEFEIIVIDNASDDASWKVLRNEFPEVHFIENHQNEGFSKANNKAARSATGKYLFFLNPDTEFEGEYIREILHFAESKENFGCLGLRMHDTKGNFLPESKRSVPDMLNSFEKLFTAGSGSAKKSYYRNDIPQDAVAEVEVITGANLMIQKDVYFAAGGFDEKYFMYGEDIDLCYTLLQMGRQNFYYGKYAMLHHKGESTVKDKVYLDRFYGAMGIFVDKYYADRPFLRLMARRGLKFRKLLELQRMKKGLGKYRASVL